MDRIDRYIANRNRIINRQHQEWILALIQPQAQWARNLGISLFAGSEIGGSFLAKAPVSGILDIWLDWSDAAQIAIHCGVQPAGALAAVLCHELGHAHTSDEMQAWENGWKIYQQMPGAQLAPVDFANVAALCIRSHQLGRAPYPSEWNRQPKLQALSKPGLVQNCHAWTKRTNSSQI